MPPPIGRSTGPVIKWCCLEAKYERLYIGMCTVHTFKVAFYFYGIVSHYTLRAWSNIIVQFLRQLLGRGRRCLRKVRPGRQFQRQWPWSSMHRTHNISWNMRRPIAMQRCLQGLLQRNDGVDPTSTKHVPGVLFELQLHQ